MKLSRKEEKEWYKIQKTLESLPNYAIENALPVFVEYLKELPNSTIRFPILFASEDPANLNIRYHSRTVAFALNARSFFDFEESNTIQNGIHLKL